jgi:ParB/RepB/Spo0J family partition protein
MLYLPRAVAAQFQERSMQLLGTFGRQTTADNTARTVLLSVDSILPSPWQPRRVFDQLSLDQLAESIHQHGLLQPVAVRSVSGGRFELIAGERRLRACRQLGQSHIKATVLNVTEKEAALLTMAENLQREDLGFFEEAEGYRRLIDELRLTQQQLADMAGVSRSTIKALENDANHPLQSLLVKLSGIFNVSCDYLINDSEGVDKDIDNFTSALIKLLVQSGKIKDVNNIPPDVVNMILASIRQDIKRVMDEEKTK